MRPLRLEESVTIAAAPERVFAWAVDPANTGWHMRRRSLVMLGAALKLEQVPAAARGVLDVARVTRCGGLLAMALLAGACAGPAVVVTAPGPGVPAISALSVTPVHIESGCPLTFRIQFDDSGRDVVRAVARWRAKTGYQRFHEGTDILPFAPEQLQGKSGGRVEVVVIPPHAGSYVYRVQLEDAQGQTSNVAEARVHVEIRPFWRRPACETPGDDTERVRRPNVLPPVVAGRL